MNKTAPYLCEIRVENSIVGYGVFTHSTSDISAQIAKYLHDGRVYHNWSPYACSDTMDGLIEELRVIPDVCLSLNPIYTAERADDENESVEFLSEKAGEIMEEHKKTGSSFGFRCDGPYPSCWLNRAYFKHILPALLLAESWRFQLL
jgi:hypothetical protein